MDVFNSGRILVHVLKKPMKTDAQVLEHWVGSPLHRPSCRRRCPVGQQASSTRLVFSNSVAVADVCESHAAGPFVCLANMHDPLWLAFPVADLQV